MTDTPFDYPRAGAAGNTQAAVLIESMLEGLVAHGLPLSLVGPSLVASYTRLYRRLPTFSPGVDKTQVPLLYSLLGSGPNPLKMAKTDAAYQDTPVSGQQCSNCSSSYTHNVSGERICSQIEGEIQPTAWCRLWNTDRL